MPGTQRLISLPFGPVTHVQNVRLTQLTLPQELSLCLSQDGARLRLKRKPAPLALVRSTPQDTGRDKHFHNPSPPLLLLFLSLKAACCSLYLYLEQTNPTGSLFVPYCRGQPVAFPPDKFNSVTQHHHRFLGGKGEINTAHL